jgi:hypothetical protein
VALNAAGLWYGVNLPNDNWLGQRHPGLGNGNGTQKDAGHMVMSAVGSFIVVVFMNRNTPIILMMMMVIHPNLSNAMR